MSRYLCDARLYDVGSFTDELTVYRVTIPVDPAIKPTCTCPAFIYKSSGRQDGTCKHIGEVAFMEPTGVYAPDDEQGQGQDVVDLMAQAFDSGLALGMKVGRAR